MTMAATLSKPARRAERPRTSQTPGAAGLRLRCFESFAALDPLRADWEALASRNSADLFTTYDWCEIWWKHFGKGRKLRVYAAFDGDDILVGIVPLFQERIRWGPLSLRVLRLVGADYGVTTAGFVIDKGQVRAVGEVLASELDTDCDWDMVHLGELPGYNTQYRELAAALTHRGWRVRHGEHEYPHMVIELGGTFDDYLQTLAPSERNNIRRRERRVQEKHETTVTIASGSRIPECFESFVIQHQEQWRGTGKLGHFGDWPGSLTFHREMVARQGPLGRLLLMCLEIDGEPIGYHYNYVYNKRAHLLLSARTVEAKWDAVSPGRLLNCTLIRTAIAAGATLIDALAGYYDHKRRLGAKILELQTITIERTGATRRVRLAAFVAATKLVDVLYHRAWYWHIAPGIRRWCPRLLAGLTSRGLWWRFVRARFLVASWRKPKVEVERA